MGCKSAAGWGAARSCTRYAALAVNINPKREKTTASIRETGVSWWSLRSKNALAAAATVRPHHPDALEEVDRDTRAEYPGTTDAGP